MFNPIKLIKRNLVQIDGALIWDVLSGMCRVPHSILMVHSSLSACGTIKGGPGAVIGCLRRWINGGTLAMPTHTYCYPDPKNQIIAFDVLKTRSVSGAITEMFRKEPDVIRSIHPTHSLACCGPQAEAITARHELCETPCGIGTPYSKLVELDCSVLMFGVSMERYTLFHTAEDAAGARYLYEPKIYELLIKQKHGGIRTFRTKRQNMSVSRKFNAMDQWLEGKEALVRTTLGLADLLFIPSALKAHNLLMKVLRENPQFLVKEEIKNRISV